MPVQQPGICHEAFIRRRSKLPQLLCEDNNRVPDRRSAQAVKYRLHCTLPGYIHSPCRGEYLPPTVRCAHDRKGRESCPWGDVPMIGVAVVRKAAFHRPFPKTAFSSEFANL